MAIIGNTMPTLLDLASRVQDGKIAKIVEIMNEKNDLLTFLPWIECNDGSGHKTTIRTGLPTPTWRQLYQGVQPTKSKTAAVRDATGLLEDYSQVDAALVDIAEDKAGFRMSEDKGHIEGMNQAFMDTFFYGNSEFNPERFTGMAKRYSVKTGVENGDNIILGGGAGSDNTSVWIMVLGEDGVSGIYPKGTSAGLKVLDKGQMTIQLSDGSKYEAYVSNYSWKPGITVRDWRQVVRIANIDISDLTFNGATGAKLVDLIVQGLELVHNPSGGKMVIVANRTITSMLRRQITNTANVHLGLNEVAGKHVLEFDGVPVLRSDSLLNTESVVA